MTKKFTRVRTTGDTVYLRNVVSNPRITVGEYTMYNDFVRNPEDFEKNNVLYHYPVNRDRLIIGKFCSIACGAKFLFNSANHSLSSLSTYPFPDFFRGMGSGREKCHRSVDNKGDIVIGNDVWIGYEAVILAGVTIGDGRCGGDAGCRYKGRSALYDRRGVPAKPIRSRFDRETTELLLRIKWWDWPEEQIARHIREIQAGDIEGIRNRYCTF